MKRTFIAVKVEVDEKFSKAVSSLREGLGNENIKWIGNNNLHITLAFIGDTDESRIKNIKSMLQKELTGSGKIEFGLKGFGVFKNFKDPHVIFTDIENPEGLAEAVRKIKEGLDNLNIIIEDRNFRPHLTIGRVKHLIDRNKLKELVQMYSEMKFQDVIINEVIFYESILLSSGPIYKPLKVIRLAN